MAYYPYQGVYGGMYGTGVMPPYNSPSMPQMAIQPSQTTQATSTSGLIWVQGEAGAKSYLVAPNTTMLLMDSEENRFFIKSTDASGMPLPLRIFEYTETTAKEQKRTSELPKAVETDYITRKEFDEFKAKFEPVRKAPENKTKKEENENGKLTV